MTVERAEHGAQPVVVVVEAAVDKDGRVRNRRHSLARSGRGLDLIE